MSQLASERAKRSERAREGVSSRGSELERKCAREGVSSRGSELERE